MLKVRDHRGNEYLANIEEDLDKVNWIIEYEDHRDTFYVVSIDDKLYAYGWWEDRYHLGEYLRKPDLFVKRSDIYDHYYGIPYIINRIIDHMYEHVKNPETLASVSASYNQNLFDDLVKTLDKAFATDHLYDWETVYKNSLIVYCPQLVRNFLVMTGLNTEENLEKLENAHWTSIRKDGVLGIAAKQDWSDHQLFHCDKLISVFQDGEWYSVENKETPYLDVTYDDLGFASYTYTFDDVRDFFAQKTLLD